MFKKKKNLLINLQGLAIKKDAEGEIHLVSEEIKHFLNIDVAVLMGANLAHEVANDDFCEATIGWLF